MQFTIKQYIMNEYITDIDLCEISLIKAGSDMYSVINPIPN